MEYGFLDSNDDDVNQLKTDYEKYAAAVVKAVLEYIGYSTLEEGNYIVKSGDKKGRGTYLVDMHLFLFFMNFVILF